MKIKKYAKKTYKTLTSPKAKSTYKAAGKTMAKVGRYTANYFDNMNRNLDYVVGTRDPNPKGRLAGVKVERRRR